MPATGPDTQRTQLPPGQGPVFRRELAARAVVAAAIILLGGAAIAYGTAALAAHADLGQVFVVFGVAAASTQAVLAASMLTARRAITADSYTTRAIRRTRRTVEACLILLIAGAVATYVIVAARATDLGLVGGLAIAMVFVLAVEGWRVFWRLDSHRAP